MKRAGMDLCRRFGRSEPTADSYPLRQPARRMRSAMPQRGETAIGYEAAIVPLVAEMIGEFGMQVEAASGESLQRRAVAPVAREKPAGFSRRGAGDRRCAR